MTTYTSSYNTLNYLVLPLATDFFVMNTIPLHKKVKLAPLPVPQELQVKLAPLPVPQELQVKLAPLPVSQELQVRMGPLPVPQELVWMNPFQTHQEERMDNLNPLMIKKKKLILRMSLGVCMYL